MEEMQQFNEWRLTMDGIQQIKELLKDGCLDMDDIVVLAGNMLIHGDIKIESILWLAEAKKYGLTPQVIEVWREGNNRCYDMLRDISYMDGTIESMKKNFKPTEEAARLERYWMMVDDVIKRCVIKADDNVETMLCKAYIKNNGREKHTFKELREHGIKMWDRNDIFIKTIFPTTQEERAKVHDIVKDEGILQVAWQMGRMRNKSY